jgi:hypothetical protein
MPSTTHVRGDEVLLSVVTCPPEECVGGSNDLCVLLDALDLRSRHDRDLVGHGHRGTTAIASVDESHEGVGVD